MKNIKEYLHFYFGQKCDFAVIVPNQKPNYAQGYVDSRVLHNVHTDLGIVKMTLRKMSEMSEPEAIEFIGKGWCKLDVINILSTEGSCIRFVYASFEQNRTAEQSLTEFSADQFKWLFENEFDVFNLNEK